jgi:hypothetical protein
MRMNKGIGYVFAAVCLYSVSSAQNQQPGLNCWQDTGTPRGFCYPPAGEPPICNPLRVIIDGRDVCYDAFWATTGQTKATAYVLTCYYIYGHWQNGECVMAAQPFVYGIPDCHDVRGHPSCD